MEMKKILAIIALFVFAFSFAQIINFGKNHKAGKILHLKDADIY